MKLRLRGDSLRLRLTQSEVARIAEGGRVEEAVRFSDEHELRWAMSCDRTTSTPTAKLAGMTIEVIVPSELARKWATSDEVGIDAVQSVGEGRSLRILIEKDFACLKPRQGEDNDDAFPNPDQNETC